MAKWLCLLVAQSGLVLALSGVVVDSTDRPIEGVRIEVRTANGTVLTVARTDSAGEFAPSLPDGSYELRIEARGFEPLSIAASASTPVRVVLRPSAIRTEVTVSAMRGLVGEAQESPYVAFEQIVPDRPMPTIGQALERQPGVLVQQTTYGQVSPFLRGLTGYHVLTTLDSVRFNNSTFRSGPNQYLAFVDPSQAESVEVLLGPAGAQYGSDSLGGSLHLTTPAPLAGGDILLQAASADASVGAVAKGGFTRGAVSILGGVAGRRHNDLRSGGGFDSRNVYRRLLGIEAPGRQQDTGFDQLGLNAKLLVRLPSDQILSIWAQRGDQDDVRGYKDLLGGLGRLRSEFDPQRLTFLYARYEKLRAGPLDALNATVSYNSQTDGSLRQGLNLSDPVTRDRNRAEVMGYAVQATKQWTRRIAVSGGADLYDETIQSTRTVNNVAARPLYPDDSRYRTAGVYGQTSIDLPHSLRASLAVRGTAVRFKSDEDTRFGVPQSSQSFSDATFSSSLSWRPSTFFGIHGLLSRGFRAPNLNDLGALGLNDLGYEIPARDAIAAGALLSTDANDSAISKNTALQSLQPESLMNYELGVRFTAKRVYARVQAFDAELSDAIVRRTLLFPAAQVPATLAGIALTPIPQTAQQRAQGVVAVGSSFDPRAVKAFVNDGRARYYGIESLLQFSATDRLRFEANYSYLVGRELDPNRFVRRLPPQSGAFTVRYFPRGRMWLESTLAASGAQSRLSGGDLDDERIGASRRRRDIADFFNGSRLQPLVQNGVFTPTGETLRQIQDRVLPGVDDSVRVPLYRETAAWAVVHVRAGMPFGEKYEMLVGIENLLDRNYRVHGSGFDAPGANAYVSMRVHF